MGVAESGVQRAAELRRRSDELARQAARIEQGNEGERKVAQLLAPLEHHGWIVLHDRLKSTRSRANIDHIVVGPPGVFVLDAKHWSGRVTLTPTEVRQNGRQRTQDVDSLLGAGDTVSASVPGLEVRSALVLVGSASTAGARCPVPVLHGGQLVPWLESWPACLDRDQVLRTAERLSAAHPPRASVRIPSPRGRREKAAPSARTRPRLARTRSRGLGPSLVAPAIALVALLTFSFWVKPLAKGVSDVLRQAMPAVPAVTTPQTQSETTAWCRRMVPPVSAELKGAVAESSAGPGSCQFVPKSGSGFKLSVAVDGAATALYGNTPLLSERATGARCGVATWSEAPTSGAQRRNLAVCFPAEDGTQAKLFAHEANLVKTARTALG